MKFVLTLTALLSLGLAAAVRADEPALAELDYFYNATWGGLDIGQVEVTLKPEGAAGCYRYSNVAHPTSLAKMLYGSPNQTSLFCIKNGQVRTQRFESVLPGDSKQTYHLDFDWDKHTVSDGAGQVREISDDAVDSFDLEIAVRLWVTAHAGDAAPPVAAFTMVDHKNLTHYQLKLAGHEKIDTAAGNVDTLRMERIDNPDKLGHFWLDPARSYMPVKSQTRVGSRPMIELNLAK